VAVEDVVAAVLDWKARVPEISLYGDYYRGRHRVGQYATPAFRKDFLWILENSRENLCKGVVRGFSSKLEITGWEGADKQASAQATEMVETLRLTKTFNLSHREAFRTGDAYVLVWPDNTGNLRPWPHLSKNVSVMPDPGNPDRLLWFAKVWLNPEGYGRVNVYYPGRVERWVTKNRLKQKSEMLFRPDIRASWPDRPNAFEEYDDGEGWEISANGLPTDRVPAIWLAHDAEEMGTHGVSILEDVIPLQDALNKSIADLIVGGEAFAQPLRYLMNYKAKRHINPETGEVTEEKIQANPTVNKILAIPGDGPFGQLDPPDATKLLAVHEAYATKVSRVTGLPAFYVSQVTGEPPTGRALRVMSTRLTDVSRETQTDFGPWWSEMMDLLGVPDVKPIWKDPAPKDETEELEDAEARKAIGYPVRENLRKLGEDEEDIERIMAEGQQQVPSGGDIAVRAFNAGVDPAELVT
jgi:hypothetical protein